MEKNVETGTDDRTLDRPDASDDSDENKSHRPIDSEGAEGLDEDIVEVKNSSDHSRHSGTY